MLGLMSTEGSHPRATGTALGMLGAFSGLGASVAGYPLTSITQAYGWSYFGLILSWSSVTSTLILLPLWSVQRAKTE